VWITGLPASGKSTIARALVRELAARGVDVAVLESDARRQVLTPHPTYRDEERDTFYRSMVAPSFRNLWRFGISGEFYSRRVDLAECSSRRGGFPRVRPLCADFPRLLTDLLELPQSEESGVLKLL
jgi:hypothetical protein